MIGSINTLERDSFEETNGGQVSKRVFSKEKIMQLISPIVSSLTFDSITASKLTDTTLLYSFANGATCVANVEFILNADNTYRIIASICGDDMLMEDGGLLLLETGLKIIL